jgi:hypothetical protein
VGAGGYPYLHNQLWGVLAGSITYEQQCDSLLVMDHGQPFNTMGMGCPRSKIKKFKGTDMLIEKKNNCYYNFDGRCTYPKPHRGWIGESGRCWDSKESCVFTQDGAQTLCTFYKIQN